MKLAFADTRSQSTELTAATLQSPIQTPKKLTAFSASARNFKNPKLLKPVVTNRLNAAQRKTRYFTRICILDFDIIPAKRRRTWHRRS
jgi:hypothetical protein